MSEKMTQEFPRDSRLDRVIFLDLLVTVVLSALAFGTVEPWSIAIFELNALVIGVLLAVRFVIDPDPEWRRLRLALPVFALVIWGVIQAAPFDSFAATGFPESVAVGELGVRTLSHDPQATREAAVKLLALVIYFAAALLALRDAQRRKTAQVLLTGFGFAVSIFAIINRLTSNGKMYWVRPVSDYIAPYGPFGNYNHFAGFIELILPLPLAYLLLARISLEQRLLWLFSAVMMAVALIFSLSRGGILAMSAEVLALLAIATLGRKWVVKDEHGAGTGNALAILGALTATAILALWIGYGQLVQRLNLTRQGASEFSVVTRVEYWQASWRMFLDHPVTGVGLGAFAAVYPNYGRSSAKYERLEQTHNDYLQLLTDAGAIGAGLGLWFLFEIVRLARRQFKKIHAARGRARAIIVGGYVAVLGLLVHSVTDFNLQITSNALLFLFVLALTTSVSFHASRETR